MPQSLFKVLSILSALVVNRHGTQQTGSLDLMVMGLFNFGGVMEGNNGPVQAPLIQYIMKNIKVV